MKILVWLPSRLKDCHSYRFQVDKRLNGTLKRSKGGDAFCDRGSTLWVKDILNDGIR